MELFSGRNRSYPLREALYRFAPRRLHRELDVQIEAPSERPVPTTPSDDQRENVKVIIQLAGALIEEVLVPKPALLEMKSHLIRQLRLGRLEARGVMIKPELGAEPGQIPAFIFDESVRFGQRNSVENFGRRFEGVEVSRPSRTNKMGASRALLTAAPSAAVSVSSPGRPSKTEEIERAIEGLVDQGIDLRNIVRRHAYKAIRQFAKEKFAANTDLGYSVPVLQRCLVRRFGKRL